MNERSIQYYESNNVAGNRGNGGMCDVQIIGYGDKKITALAGEFSGLYVRTCAQAKSSSVAAKIISDDEKAERILELKKEGVLLKIKNWILSIFFSLLFSLVFSLISFGTSNGFTSMFIIMFGVFFIYFALKGNIIKIKRENDGSEPIDSQSVMNTPDYNMNRD